MDCWKCNIYFLNNSDVIRKIAGQGISCSDRRLSYIGYQTPDNVVYLTDCLSSRATLTNT